MKNIIIKMSVLALFLFASAAVFAIDVSMSDSARFDIVSRTSFGINLDETYRYGLSNELTQFDLVFGLAPYQRLGNRLTTPDAVGFIELTLFHLDLIKITKKVGYSDPSGIGTNRYQTGEFLVGIAKGDWLIQLNAQGNEPFTSPWNKGLQFINDGFKVSWAYLDSMVDIQRINAISGVPVITRRGEENMLGDGQTGPHATMKQFGFDTLGNIADRFGLNFAGNMIAVMYNTQFFGVNLKLGTEYSYESASVTEEDKNGLAAGIDAVITPTPGKGLKVFLSVAGNYNYSFDEYPDQIYGGTRIGYTIPLNEDISIEPWAGFDIGTQMKEEIELSDGTVDAGGFEVVGYEFSVGGTMRFPGSGGWLKDYIVNSDGRVFPGMSLGYKIYKANKYREKDTLTEDVNLEHSIKFTMFEPRGDEGIFFGLGSEIIIDVIDLFNVTKGKKATANSPAGGFSILATAYFDYDLGKVGKLPGSLIPWTIIYFDNLPDPDQVNNPDGRINDMKIDLGLNLENAISNTTFSVVWNSGSLIQQVMLGEEYHWGYLRFMVEIRL